MKENITSYNKTSDYSKKYITVKNYNSLSDEEKNSGNFVVTKDVSIIADSNDSLTATFIITTENPDTDNDVIKADGINISSYLNNPVVLWQHNRDIPPIGKCIKLQKVSNINGASGWTGTVQFMPKEIDNYSYKIFEMIKNGFLNAVSIGFMVKDIENNSHGGFNILESVLYEFSIVTVPANSECLIIPTISEEKCSPDLSEQTEINPEKSASDDHDEQKRNLSVEIFKRKKKLTIMKFNESP